MPVGFASCALYYQCTAVMMSQCLSPLVTHVPGFQQQLVMLDCSPVFVCSGGGVLYWFPCGRQTVLQCYSCTVAGRQCLHLSCCTPVLDGQHAGCRLDTLDAIFNNLCHPGQPDMIWQHTAVKLRRRLSGCRGWQHDTIRLPEG